MPTGGRTAYMSSRSAACGLNEKPIHIHILKRNIGKNEGFADVSFIFLYEVLRYRIMEWRVYSGFLFLDKNCLPEEAEAARRGQNKLAGKAPEGILIKMA